MDERLTLTVLLTEDGNTVGRGELDVPIEVRPPAAPPRRIALRSSLDLTRPAHDAVTPFAHRSAQANLAFLQHVLAERGAALADPETTVAELRELLGDRFSRHLAGPDEVRPGEFDGR